LEGGNWGGNELEKDGLGKGFGKENLKSIEKLKEKI